MIQGELKIDEDEIIRLAREGEISRVQEAVLRSQVGTTTVSLIPSTSRDNPGYAVVHHPQATFEVGDLARFFGIKATTLMAQ